MLLGEFESRPYLLFDALFARGTPVRPAFLRLRHHHPVNRRKFDETNGVKSEMTGAEIAALVNVPADNAIVRGPHGDEIGIGFTVARTIATRQGENGPRYETRPRTLGALHGPRPAGAEARPSRRAQLDVERP